MAKVHDFVEIWQGSQNLHATQNESRAQNKQMTSLGYISATEEIVKASWSLFQHVGAAAFKFSERSTVRPPFTAKDLAIGQTQMLLVRRIRRINLHPVDHGEDSEPEIISDTEDWLNWNGDLDNPNDSEDDCVANVESNMDQHNSIEDPESPEQWDLTAEPNIPGLIQPTQKSKSHAEKVLVMVNAIKMRRNQGVRKM